MLAPARPLAAAAAALLALAVPVVANWNENVVGPSKHYDELETDTMKKKVFRKEEDVVVVIYSDGCSLCQDLHPQQEKAAERIKKKTDKIRFARVDQYRMGPPEALFNGDLEPFKEDEIPKMFFVKAGASVEKERVLRIPHGDIGWGKKGWKALYKWLKENSSFLGEKGKDAKALPPAEDETKRKAEEEEAQKKAEDEASKNAADERKQIDEEAKKKADNGEHKKAEEVEAGMATPTSIKKGMTATVTTDMALLEQECLASGLNWPHVRNKAGRKGQVLDIDLSDSTAKIDGDIDWMPIKSLKIREAKEDL